MLTHGAVGIPPQVAASRHAAAMTQSVSGPMRPLVSAVEEGGVEEAITTAIVALAKRIGLITVAEGIESAEESERVRALGCDLGQGYFIARPVPADRLWVVESPAA